MSDLQRNVWPPGRCVQQQQIDAIFVVLKLQQVSNMFETPAISRRQIALKITPGLCISQSKPRPPETPGRSGDLTRPKPGFNALLMACRPRVAVDVTKCLETGTVGRRFNSTFDHKKRGQQRGFLNPSLSPTC